MLDTYKIAVDTADNSVAVTAYRALSSGDKARARVYLADAIKSAVMAGDLATAQSLLAIQSDQSVKVAEATTVNWDMRLAVRVATLRRAADRIMSGEAAVSGIPADVTVDWDHVEALLDGTADGLVVDNDAADKIAAQSVGRGTVAPGGDIAAHVVEALSQNDGDFMTVADIRNTVTDAYPGDQRPSAGAISARLFPRDGGDCTIDGVTPVPATKDAPNGARLDG